MVSSRYWRSQRPAAPGFVLAMTLWFLAGIGVVVGLVTLWSLERVRDATIDRERLEEAIAVVSTRDTLVYLAATRDMTLAGLPIDPIGDDERAAAALQEFGGLDRSRRGNELRLDGQPYEGVDQIVFAAQDEAGLFPLGWPSAPMLDRFLAVHGIAREQIPNLRDPLLDYIDFDDLRHLHGAESRDYERASMAPPPNRRLLLPQELARVMGWHDLPIELRDRMQEVSTTFYLGGLNLNTAPEELLAGWLPGCPETCEVLMERRRAQPFFSKAQIQGLLGVILPGEDGTDYRYSSSDTLRLTLWGRTGMAQRFHVKLTPSANQRAPWQVLAAYPVPRPRQHAAPEPTHSALFADPQADQ